MKERRPIPFNVLTGFLGAGKSTLLQQILTGASSQAVAVFINEFGEVPVDHLLVDAVKAETVLLKNGCVCCSIRGELKTALLGLLARLRSGELPPVERVILETSGLTEPGSVVATILNDSQLCHQFQVASIVTCIDAKLAEMQATAYPEWMAQVAAAEKILITKADLVTRVELLKIWHYVQGINPVADIFDSTSKPQLGDLFTDRLPADSSRFNVSDASEHVLDRHLPPESHALGLTQSFFLEIDRTLNWERFALWLSLLLHAHGNKVLRIKGVLRIEGTDDLIIIQGVQHLIHPPIHLTKRMAKTEVSKLVFIVRDLDPDKIRRSFAAFGLAEPKEIPVAAYRRSGRCKNPQITQITQI
jgi:G3E family GTPase